MGKCSMHKKKGCKDPEGNFNAPQDKIVGVVFEWVLELIMGKLLCPGRMLHYLVLLALVVFVIWYLLFRLKCA